MNGMSDFSACEDGPADTGVEFQWLRLTIYDIYIINRLLGSQWGLGEAVLTPLIELAGATRQTSHFPSTADGGG